MITYERDANGILVAYKDGQRIGPIYTMGDDIIEEEQKEAETNGDKKG